MSPEVLLYIQNVKNYIRNNSDAQKYFLFYGDEDEFISYVTKISEENMTEKGSPELTMEQFEDVRSSLKDKNKVIETIFISLGNFGLISLN